MRVRSSAIRTMGPQVQIPRGNRSENLIRERRKFFTEQDIYIRVLLLIV